MPQWLLHVLVFPLAMVNLLVGFLMFAASHQLVLLSLDLMRQRGLTETLTPFTYLQRSVGGFAAVILGLVAFILFFLLEHLLSKAATQNALFIRFMFMVGIQLIYLGLVQLVTLVLVRSAAANLLSLAFAELVFGIIFLVVYRPARKVRPKRL